MPEVKWYKYPAVKPSVGERVAATLQHWNTKRTIVVAVVYVGEDDVDFRTADDLSEISYDWTPISFTRDQVDTQQDI